MVVIVLAGILVSLVTINIAPDPRQQLQREAQRVGQLMALAADESRITQQPIVWEADLRGYRFVTESAATALLTGDDLLRSGLGTPLTGPGMLANADLTGAGPSRARRATGSVAISANGYSRAGALN